MHSPPDWEKDPRFLKPLDEHVPFALLGSFTGWKKPKGCGAEFELKRYPIDILVFERPNTGIYRMVYTKVADTLFVGGDVGEAAYRWPGANPAEIDLRWISRCDLGYFFSKCVASEEGRRFTQWNGDQARERLHDSMRQQFGIEPADVDAGEEAVWPEEYEELRRKFDESGGDEALEFRDEWNMWLATNGYDVLGEDVGHLAGVGDDVHIRCVFHLLGLRLAFERLDAKPEKKVLKVLDEKEKTDG